MTILNYLFRRLSKPRFRRMVWVHSVRARLQGLRDEYMSESQIKSLNDSIGLDVRVNACILCAQFDFCWISIPEPPIDEEKVDEFYAKVIVETPKWMQYEEESMKQDLSKILKAFHELEKE